MRLLITRPTNQAGRTAEKLQSLGYECTIEPLLMVEETGNELPCGQFDAIIITSSNALPALDRGWSIPNRPDIPVITTGEVTKSEIEALGFENCHSVNGSASDLADNFSRLAPDATNVLYPRAEEVSLNLVQKIGSFNCSCTPWVVYKVNAIQKWTPDTLELLKERKIDGVLLYSSKTAKSFARLWEKYCQALPVPQIFALSEKICGALPSEMSQCCCFPANPNENDLFKLISKSTINCDK